MKEFDIKPLYVGLLVLVVAIVIFLVWMGSTYNRFVEMEEDIDAHWAEIRNQEQRKIDLIPDLVNQSEGYQEFEKSTLSYYQAIRAVIGQSAELDAIIGEERKHVVNLFRVAAADAKLRSVDESF